MNDFKISLAHDIETGQKLEKEVYDKFLADFKASADNDELRQAFAASLSIPILKNIPPQTSVRNIFAVDVIPNGALAEYPIDLNDIETAIILPRIGAVPMNTVVGDSLIVPTFEVANSVDWKLSFVRDGRFNIVERALEKLAQAFIRLEEGEGWRMVRAACDGTNTIGTPAASLTKDAFNDFITYMSKTGYTPTDIYVSPNRAKDIRTWTYTTLDPWTQREIFQAGGLNQIWNVALHELRTLSDGEAYLFDTGRFGVMPIRSELQTYDDPTLIRRLRAGVVAWQEFGFAVLDKKAVSKLTFS
jgi:hypothetical protein